MKSNEEMKKGTEFNEIERRNEKDPFEKGEQHLIVVVCYSTQQWVILLDISSC
jgi:hypothetical protein